MKICHFEVPAPANAGDLLLSHSLRKLVEYTIGKQKWTMKKLRNYTDANQMRKINEEHDAILVGGGGLFLRDTNANNNSGWQWNTPIAAIREITKPFALFAVGYNRFRGQKDFEPIFKKHLTEVEKKASFIGLRNTGSMNCVANYIKDEKIRLQPCSTTLAREIYDFKDTSAWDRGDKTMGFTVAFDRSHSRYGKKQKSILMEITKSMRWFKENGWKVLIVNQHQPDIHHAWSKEMAKEFEVRHTCHKSPHKTIEMYNDIAMVVGSRGHSQMIPFGMNNAFFSLICHNKLQYFLEDINEPTWGVETKEDNLCKKIINQITDMDNNREKVKQSILTNKKRFIEATKNNLNLLV